MCFASAEGRSRDAREDEVLIVTRRPYGSNWLVSPDDMDMAVCLNEGTKIELLYIPEQTQRQFGLLREAQATFKMEHWWRRDVFVLETGQKVPLKKLQEGQVVRVLPRDKGMQGEDTVPATGRADHSIDNGQAQNHVCIAP